MTNTKLKIFAAIIVIALSGAAFWFFMLPDIEIFKSLNIETFKSLNFKSLNPENQRSTPLDQDLTGQVSEKSANMSETYSNSKYGFSFHYSKEFNTSEFSEGDRDVILVKDETGDGFQISITPFDEPGPITKERILKDIPDMRINSDKEISVGGEKALSFSSKEESLETLEIWFVHLGNLYQISAFASFEKQMMKILDTWRFQ